MSLSKIPKTLITKWEKEIKIENVIVPFPEREKDTFKNFIYQLLDIGALNLFHICGPRSTKKCETQFRQKLDLGLGCFVIVSARLTGTNCQHIFSFQKLVCKKSVRKFVHPRLFVKDIFVFCTK